MTQEQHSPTDSCACSYHWHRLPCLLLSLAVPQRDDLLALQPLVSPYINVCRKTPLSAVFFPHYLGKLLSCILRFSIGSLFYQISRVPGSLITILPIKGRNLRRAPRDPTHWQVSKATTCWGDMVAAFIQRWMEGPG